MGGYLRKSKGIEEVAEIGAKMTRAQEVVDGEETVVVKKRKIGEDEVKPPSPAAPSLLQLVNNDRGSVIPENLVSPVKRSRVHASCCSGNETSDLNKVNAEIVDLEEGGADIVTSNCNSECAKSENTPPLGTESGKLVSPAVKPKKPKLTWVKVEMPSAKEIDEFFAAAEQKMAKHFAEKYNFDFQNEKPLEGRWEWVKVSQRTMKPAEDEDEDEIRVALQ